jgi:gliding motility-associated-like protein
MPSFKPLLLFFILLCFTFLFPTQVHAQASRFYRVQNHVNLGVDPRNARAIDSLQMLNDPRLMTNRMLVPIQRPVNMPVKGANALSTSSRFTNITQPLPLKRQAVGNRLTSSVCYTVSGRNFLRQDSLFLWTGNPTFTSDGNVIVSGQFADYARSPLVSGGFCMKTDIQGNVLWAKLYDSATHKDFDYFNFFRSIELRDGSILIASRTTNRLSGNDDFVLTKLDKDGNIIWLKTYESKFWQGFNGSGDLFGLSDLKEDPATGDLYFVGFHWGGTSTITKVDPTDGHIIWSNGYHTSEIDRAFGIVINSGNLILFQLENGYYNESYIDATAISKTNGDTLFSKHYSQTGGRYAPRLYNTFEVVRQNNGHFLLSGPTTGSWEYPDYTGNIDLYHAGIIELDENLDFVKAYGFKNRIHSNTYNARISLYPDGSGVFTMLDLFPGYGYTAEAHVSLFSNEQIYHQRKRLHYNEGLPYEPPTLRLPDGGFLNIKVMGDSTKTAIDGSRIDYYRMHTSDTASVCLGVKDSTTSLWYFHFEPIGLRIDSIYRNVFRESRIKTLDSWNFAAHPGPACEIISHCDTLALKASAETVCPGTGVTITIHKNKECGSLVPLVYDTNWVRQATKLDDTTYAFQFNQPGKGYIRASLMGCVLHQDSVMIEVIPAKFSLDLGKDTVICPGNSITLNAGKGFASYTWQDGSTDSTFTVKAPGMYYVATTNSCGTNFRDTIKVADHPPVPIDIGPDRTKCNNDTVQISAPPGFLNYEWSNNYNLSSMTAQTVIVNPLMDTCYFIKAEQTPGCFAYDTVRVSVNHSPQIDLGADKSFCSGDSAVFNAGSGFGSYLWNNGTSSQKTTVKNAGSYSVVGITAEGCKSYDTVRVVNVFSNPIVYLDHSGSLCEGTTRVLDAGSFSSYLWNNGSRLRTLTISDIGMYVVEVSDNNGCIGRDSTTLTTLLPLPKGFLPMDTAVCSYGSFELRAPNGYSAYFWNNGASASSITIRQPGVYWLQVKDNNNCTGKDTIVVNPKDCMKGFYIPSAFTPNGDGRNDIFRPMLFGNVKRYQFAVYNRWGEVIYLTTELSKGWNGKFDSSTQDTNVFVWSCTFQLEGEEIKTEKGTVVLIR